MASAIDCTALGAFANYALQVVTLAVVIGLALRISGHDDG